MPSQLGGDRVVIRLPGMHSRKGIGVDAYRKVAAAVRNPVGWASALNEALPPIWAAAYPSTGGEIVTVTLGGKAGEIGAVSTMFDLQPGDRKTMIGP